MNDILFKNATIVDGTGAPSRRGDVTVGDGRITGVGAGNETAARVIDADGLCLAPGFIDMHGHTDEALLINPTAESKITQGVTLELSGNCGSCPAPIVSEHQRAHIEEWLQKYNVEQRWTSMDEYFGALESSGMAMNLMTLVGHGSLRSAVVGPDDRPATPDEMAAMKQAVAKSMEQGAVGLSSGLVYAPGCYGGTDELVELSKPVGERNGIYATHMRSEADNVVTAVAEALTIGEKSGARVQISHHKACGPANWGKVNQTLAMIEDARSRGIDAAADQYPYVATSTGLSVNLPRWAHDGGTEKMLERLKTPDLLPRLRQETKYQVENGYKNAEQGWIDIVIAGVKTEANKWTEGLSVADIARKWQLDYVDAMFRLLLEEEGSVGMVHFTLSEDDVETVMRRPYVMIGSDATARAITGPLATGMPHPRTFGTMPRVLAHYVREKGVLTLEDAVHRMTGLAAERLGLKDRGKVAEGYIADLTLFDPATVRDASQFGKPFQMAEGIPYVFVRGVPVVDEGRVTGSLPGRCLRAGTA